MNRTVLPAALLLAGLAALPSCAPVEPRWAGMRQEDYFRRHRKHPPAAWSRIYVDGALAGYLKDERIHKDRLRYLTTYWVYDENFRQLGFFTDHGTTVRNIGPDGSDTVGSFSTEESILAILGISSIRTEGRAEKAQEFARVVTLEPMPRAWELDREDAESAEAGEG